jgi:hypothetical protein
MAGVDVDREAPPAPVTIIMGTSDESVPYAQVKRVWESWTPAPRSSMLTIEGGDHGLTAHVDVIEHALREALIS